ncbi:MULTISPECIES: hypothetical protein [unclassified Rhizobium]|jgi:hypothetical protein|uniref:hypothetical protein n=1 Tax=unclassified Rhizobium TaxID=2613769 RepID=UPI0011D129A9|nr:hypothetical protein [Rhizobium sp. BG4]QRM44220.1 hypothetical protein F2982_12630 [Rhizobium sp. BG4]
MKRRGKSRQGHYAIAVSDQGAIAVSDKGPLADPSRNLISAINKQNNAKLCNFIAYQKYRL